VGHYDINTNINMLVSYFPDGGATYFFLSS